MLDRKRSSIDFAELFGELNDLLQSTLKLFESDICRDPPISNIQIRTRLTEINTIKKILLLLKNLEEEEAK